MLSKSRGKRSKEIALSFSVTCSTCDRRFVDIDESLIGQQARCRCGSIVELDPEWDFKKKNKTNRRQAGTNRPVAPARSAKTAESKKRGPKVAPATKRAKTRTSTNHSSDARRKKQRPKSTKPTSASVAPAASSPTKSNVDQDPAGANVKREPDLVFDNYADLDQILEAGVDRTPLESTRVDSPFETPTEAAAKPNRRGLVSAAIAGSTGLLGAIILLLTRVTPLTGTPMGWTGSALYGSYTASIGTGEMTTACTNLFIGLGWLLLLLAVLIGIASAMLLTRVVIQIASDRKTLAWSRGLLASLSVVCLFTLMGLMFVETIHHANLIRELDSFSDSAPIQGLLEPADEFATFHDVRVKYESESTDFKIGLLAFAVLPLVSFGAVAMSLLLDDR